MCHVESDVTLYNIMVNGAVSYVKHDADPRTPFV